MTDRMFFWAAVTTMVTWTAVTVLSVLFMNFGQPTAAGAAIFIIIMGGIGVGGTISIWEAVGKLAAQEAKALRTHEKETRKVKRSERDRVARLVERLDEDDLVELETLLLARDDEPLN